nr:hypothetical protein [Tanacetum cinerariifolium]
MNKNFYNSSSLSFDQTQPSQFPVIHPPPHQTSIEILHDQENNRPAFYNDDDDDDVDYTIAITPVLSTEKSDNSLNIRDEHLDTIPETESEEVMKSSVKDLVLIPSESEGIPDTMCDVHLVNNPTPLEAKDHFEIVINCNDDISSSDDNTLYNENIEYVEASPHDNELFSLEVAEIVILEDEEIEDDNLRQKLLNVHLLIANIEALNNENIEYVEASPHDYELFSLEVAEIVILEDEEIEDDNLRQKLLNVHLLIANIEALKDNPTPSFEILTNTTTHFDISLPDYEAFCFDDGHIKEISSGSTTTHSDISLSEYDSFIFDPSNDQFPPTDRSDFTHEEFANELAHITSPPEYDCFYFRNLPDLVVQYSRKFKDSCQRILSSKSSFPQLQLGIHMGGIFDLIAPTAVVTT